MSDQISEKLNSFLKVLSGYNSGVVSDSFVMERFKALEYDDKVWCYFNVKNKSCVSLKEKFREEINQYFLDKVNELAEKYHTEVKSTHVSSMIYMFTNTVYFHYFDYRLHWSDCVRVKLGKGKIIPITQLDDVEEMLNNIPDRTNRGNEIIEKINIISSLPYIEDIRPRSHWAADKYEIYSVFFDVKFWDYIHNNYVKEYIGDIRSLNSCDLSITYLESKYKEFHKDAIKNMDEELFLRALKNNQTFQEKFYRLKEKCKRKKEQLNLRMHYDENAVFLKCGYKVLHMWKFNDLFTGFENEMEQFFEEKINEQFLLCEKVESCIKEINSCKNRLWEASYIDGTVTITILDPDDGEMIYRKEIEMCDECDVKERIQDVMLSLLDYAENYRGIRFFWR